MRTFAELKAQFHLPQGIVYLDGNSLGPLPKAAMSKLTTAVEEEWGEQLIRAWNTAGWMHKPRSVGDRVGRLIGAPPGSVVMGDTLSIKIFQALAAGLKLRPARRVILSDDGNFPTDLYIAQGLARLLGEGYQLKTVAPEAVEATIDGSVAVLLLTHVDYRTGRMHDMARLTEKAHAAGAVVVWDLAHSAGACLVDVAACKADFAAGCTYKYLNGGPGSPAFIYVRPDLADVVEPALSGWMGHRQPFAFDLGYVPGAGIDRMRVGTPAILALTVLEAALDIWACTNMAAVRARSVELTELFIAECSRQTPELVLISPRDATRRGSQVSLRHANAYKIMQALIERGVIGDMRAPDVLRFGFAPLYNDEADVVRGVVTLREVLEKRLWDDPRFAAVNAVT